jgi:ABC-2 type transport system ATP-binding protein
MAEVERLADRVILLHAGHIIEDGAPADLIATYGKETLEEVFLDVVRGRAVAPLEKPEDRASPARKAS